MPKPRPVPTTNRGTEPRGSEERFRLLVESVQDYAIFMLDLEGRVESWNLGAERIKGYVASEIIGHHFSEFYPPEDVAQGKPEWELRTAAELGHMEDEGWRVRKDGSRFWANVVITALRDGAGELMGFAKVTRDLTERRANEALLEADRRKDEFLALLAHELRNPLAPIRSSIEVLCHQKATDETRLRAAEIARRQMTQMAHLLDDLLDIARIGEGRLELQRELVDLASVVERAVESVRPSIVERGHELVVQVPPATLWVEGDVVRLQQVVVNLLNNAVKYTDPPGEISLSAALEGPTVVMKVADTGIGIDPVIAPHIFEPFVQAERRLEASKGGIGVGLTLVKRLVELHDGNVAVRSAGKGHGSEFVVSLPAAQPAIGAAPEHEEEASSTPEGPLRILVVDDNVDSADSVAMWLGTQGKEVAVAYDGESAERMAFGFRPDAAVLDIGMRGMDGYELARRLRATPETRDATLVALTGWGQERDVQAAREAGFDHHVVKPADLGELLALIEKPERA